jgi:hypothetical protein
MPVFKLRRKLEQQKSDHKFRYGLSKCHIVVSVDPVDSVPVRCIEVSSKSHLYLAGTGMVPTHNTTQESKDRAMNAYRDLIERGHGVIHSKILCNEMKIIVREDDGFLGASGRGKDDCTIASAIASECYVRYFVVKLKQMELNWAKERAKRNQIAITGHDQTAQEATIARSVGSFMGKIGIKYGE